MEKASCSCQGAAGADLGAVRRHVIEDMRTGDVATEGRHTTLRSLLFADTNRCAYWLRKGGRTAICMNDRGWRRSFSETRANRKGVVRTLA